MEKMDYTSLNKNWLYLTIFWCIYSTFKLYKGLWSPRTVDWQKLWNKYWIFMNNTSSVCWPERLGEPSCCESGPERWPSSLNWVEQTSLALLVSGRRFIPLLAGMSDLTQAELLLLQHLVHFWWKSRNGGTLSSNCCLCLASFFCIWSKKTYAET